MNTIQLNNNFSVNFYPESTLHPDIRCATGFYGVDFDAHISYEDAKAMITALQDFVDTVEAAKKKQEANA